MRVEIGDGHVEDLVIEVGRFGLVHLLNYEEEVGFNDWLLGSLRSLLYISGHLLYYLFGLSVSKRWDFYLLILLFIDILLL